MVAEMVAKVEEFEFQAETRQLLELMIHALYTSKEIFLRELISNGSDALDRLRFEALTDPQLLADGDRYEIILETDRDARTLSISDTGIGMSREELIANIGTIAKSGTRELRERIKVARSSEILAELIGQFGVGFYASFMVADKVTLVTRRAGENTASMWESIGDGTYRLSETWRPGPGTTVLLHLKPVDQETGIEDFTDPWVLSRIVKKYSDFVAYPVICKHEIEADPDEDLKEKKDPSAAAVVEETVLNSMKPIWTRPQKEISDDEYAEFYRHISDDFDTPFKTITAKAEGTIEYCALLFIPRRAPHDLFYHGAERGLRLYAKRVMIMKRCEELVPTYLRFIRGVVDSADLPLNISRQMLQQDRHVTQIRKRLTRKVLDTLQDLFENDHPSYLEFWGQFGRALKEGVSSDYENKERILSLLLFPSSNHPEKLTTLKGYAERMKESQSNIYYLTGQSRSLVENSPHLEAIKERGYEVLYLIDPVDELLVQSIMDHEGKRLKSVAKGVIDLGPDEKSQQAEREMVEKESESAGLLELMQKHLDAYIKQVRLTNRLSSSPVCLVGTEMDYSPQLERLLLKGNGGGPKQRRIMELNPQHEILNKLIERHKKGGADQEIRECAELLLYHGLLAEGSELPDPVRFDDLLAKLIAQSL